MFSILGRRNVPGSFFADYNVCRRCIFYTDNNVSKYPVGALLFVLNILEVGVRFFFDRVSCR